MLVILLRSSITLFLDSTKKKEELLISKWLFDETKLAVIRLPFGPRNEKVSKRFISKLQTFTNGKIRFNIIWNTSKIQPLFSSKYKVEHFKLCCLQRCLLFLCRLYWRNNTRCLNKME